MRASYWTCMCVLLASCLFAFLSDAEKTGSGTVGEKGNNIRLEVIGSFPFGFQSRAYPLIVAIRLTVLHIEWHMSLYLYTFIFICEYLSRLSQFHAHYITLYYSPHFTLTYPMFSIRSCYQLNQCNSIQRL